MDSQAPMYYRGANAAIIVYDITSEKSFEGAKRWISGVRVWCVGLGGWGVGLGGCDVGLGGCGV